jgi:hypothetical protein
MPLYAKSGYTLFSNVIKEIVLEALITITEWPRLALFAIYEFPTIFTSVLYAFLLELLNLFKIISFLPTYFKTLRTIFIV